jgi:hypothetical protein
VADIVTLSPQDPLPERHSVVVLRRFDETNPRATVIEMVVRNAAGAESTTIAVRPDGRPMTWEEAAAAAQSRAAAEGLPHALLIDRTEGTLAREILRHGGDHSFTGEPLEDTDPEDGETGTDMRDRRPP